MTGKLAEDVDFFDIYYGFLFHQLEMLHILVGQCFDTLHYKATTILLLHFMLFYIFFG